MQATGRRFEEQGKIQPQNGRDGDEKTACRLTSLRAIKVGLRRYQSRELKRYKVGSRVTPVPHATKTVLVLDAPTAVVYTLVRALLATLASIIGSIEKNKGVKQLG